MQKIQRTKLSPLDTCNLVKRSHIGGPHNFVRFWATCLGSRKMLPWWQTLAGQVAGKQGGPKSDKIVWPTNMTPFHKVTSVQLGQFSSLNFLHILLDQKTFFPDFLLLWFSQQTYYKSEHNKTERKNRRIYGIWCILSLKNYVFVTWNRKDIMLLQHYWHEPAQKC